MRSLSVRLLLSLLALSFAPLAMAHDITLTGTSTFASLDGSSADHDGTVNGVFTVNDGNLVVNGVVSCNDDMTTNACSMAFSVSGNMTVNAGGALYAENRSGSGVGGAISITTGGALSLNGNAIISSASRSSSGSSGGAITANVSGGVAIGPGSTIDSGSSSAAAGAILIASGGSVTVDGNVLSGPSRTILATRLGPGPALDGDTNNTTGGSITISSSAFSEPGIVIGANANVVSQGGDLGAGPITIDACGIQVRGLLAALSKKAGAGSVRIRSGKDVLVDGRDLGASGARMGRIRADAPTGTAINKGIDIFAAETIDLFGPASGTMYLLTSLPGVHDSKSYGGVIRVTSTGDAVNGSGKLIDDGHSASGDTGGNVEIAAKGDVTLATAEIRAHGDFNTSNSNRGGGLIAIRSHSGSVVWTNGVGEVRPVGSTSGLAPADQGRIVINACGTINTAGTTFPVEGVPTSPLPETNTGVCAPAAPSLPSGVPPLIACNTPPVANDTSASTKEDTTVTITLSGSDAEGDSLTFTIVSGPSNGSLGTIITTGPSTATVDYTPNLNYNGSDAFVFRANDGNGGTDDATATITIAPVNDPPSFLAGPTVTLLEDSGAFTYANWATAISAGPADESGQSVTFSVSTDNPALFSVQPSLAADGTLTFTPAANAFGSASLSVVANDNGGTANGGDDTSNAQNSSVTVNPVNDAPTFVAGGDQSVNEDAGPQTVAGWASSISAGPNESSQSLSFTVSNDNNALFSVQPSIDASGTLTYTPAANAFGTAHVTAALQDNGGTANGGVDTSGAAAFQIVIGAVNDAPAFTSGGDVTVNEDSGPYSAPWASAISAGPANEAGQTVAFAITSNSNAALFATAPSVAPDGTLTFVPAANASGSAVLTVALSDNGGTANGGADTSAAVSFTIYVSDVNDPPSFTPGGDVTVNEDSGTYSATWATAISAGAGESQPLTFSVTSNNPALFVAPPAINSSGLLTFTPALNAFGTANVTVTLSDGIDSTSPVSFMITVNGINDPPAANADTWETEGNTELRVDVGTGITPSVMDTTSSGKGVADNDADTVEGDPFTVTGIVGCGDTVSPYTCAVAGGTVRMNSNGSFSFEPSAGATGASFQYTVTDQPTAGTPASATGSVTITIHDMIWYVNGSASPGNGTSGAPFNSFAALDDASDVDGAGDYIFVHSSAVAGTLNLEAGQRLWGEGVGLIIPRNLNGNGSPATLVAPGIKPVVTQVAGDTITVTGVSGVEIAGLSLSAPGGNAIDVTSVPGGPATGGSIYRNTISAGSEGIDINADSEFGTSVRIDGTNIVSVGNGVDLLASDGNVTFAYTNGSILSSAGSGIFANGAAADILFVSGLSNVTIDGNTSGDGIALTAARFDANPGTISIDTVSTATIAVGSAGNPVGGAAVSLIAATGSLAFGSLDAFASSNGVSVTGGAGGLTVTSSGGTIVANSGVGLSVLNASIGTANLTFDSISAAGGPNGIALNTTGAAGGLRVLGTGTAGSGGTIQNTSSHGVSLASTFNPSFNNLTVQNTGGSGVKGTRVSGFAYTNGAISNSGTGGGVNESNIAFNATGTGTESNLSGDVTITGNALSNALWHGIDVTNFSGTLGNLIAANNVITSGTTTATSKGSGIRVQILGSAATVAHLTKASIANNNISNFPSGAGIQVLGGNTNVAGSPGTVGISGSGSDIVSITGNEIRGLSTAVRMGTSAIIAGVSGRGQANFDISNNGTITNPLTNMAGVGISVGANGLVDATVTTSNNVIVANNTLASAGIGGGSGAVFSNNDTPALNWTISGNSIRNSDGNGILAVARGARGLLTLKIQNNTVGASLTGVRQGIRVDAGNAASLNDTVCLNISGNSSAGSGGTTGIGLRKQGTNAVINGFGIHGLPSSPAGSPVVETYVDSQNPAGGGTLLLSGTSGFTACSNP